MMRNCFRAASLGLLFLAVSVLAGCGEKIKGPKLAPVSGTITSGGKPLANALVRFEPQNVEIGRGSTALTDAEGRYSMDYTPNEKGAVVGSHIVRISVLDKSERETLPDKYNSKSTLTADVPEGGKTFDFTVDAK